jgi:hypothetical protein
MEQILNWHSSAVAEDARLLREEGDLISAVQRCGYDDPESYLTQLDSLINYKLQIYTDLANRVKSATNGSCK